MHCPQYRLDLVGMAEGEGQGGCSSACLYYFVLFCFCLGFFFMGGGGGGFGGGGRRSFLVGYISMIVWTPAVLSVLYACVLYLYYYLF